MSNDVSNLYAAKIYSEHPLALWALDDDISYLSILDSSQKSLSSWPLSNLELVTSGYQIPNEVPLSNEDMTVLSIVSTASGVSGSVVASDSWEWIQESRFDGGKSSVCISAYVYAYTDLVDSYEIGFIKDGQEYKETFITLGQEKWQKISYTIDIVDTQSLKPFIRVNYAIGGPLSGNDYDIMINAVSLGQWSEAYNGKTTGAIPTNLNNEFLASLITPCPQYIKVIEADAYGLSQTDNGYYIVDNYKLLAQNINLPMVYGSSNTTVLRSPITYKMPNLVFPGKGFLNDSGIYNEITAEFWLKIYANSQERVKIFGPLINEDGLYVEEEFLTLSIGKYTQSYFVGKWYRPMLIDIRYTPNNASVLINGDLVISIDIELKNLSFPGSEYDYVAFYKNSNIKAMEIDCFAVYPYSVSEQNAKKRFVYAQGVDNAENIASNFDGESIYIDFPFAKYTSTISYPDMNNWSAGFFNNLEANSKYLGFNNYSPPEVIFSGNVPLLFDGQIELESWTGVAQQDWSYWTNTTWEDMAIDYAADFYRDNFFIQDENYNFIKLRPNELYEEIYTNIYFETINPISTPVKSIMGVFRAPGIIGSNPQTIMYFSNKTNSNVFKVTLNDEGLKYIYNDEVIKTKSVLSNNNFVVGFDIDQINSSVANFFSNPHTISLNLGNYITELFEGKIYNLTINNRLFTDKDFSNYIDEDGFFGFGESFLAEQQDNDTFLFNYIGNYTLSILNASDSLVLDVGVAGYWEDSVPLSYFGKYINTSSGDKYYDLDMLQFNIDYPAPITLTQIEEYETGDDFRIKSYITLQDFSQVGEIPYSNYNATEIIGANRVLDFDNTTDIIYTKFEVVDGTIIFPPKELVDFEDYYITIHIEAKTSGVNTKPMIFKKMSLSSIAFDETSFYPIGTRTGNNIYPFTRYSTGYSYKDKNPFSIYRDSTPYLYLTADSGISVLPYASTADRGISIPLNQAKSQTYLLGGIQLWMFYNKDYKFESTIKIARISALDKILDVYAIPEFSQDRAKIIVYNAKTGIQDSDVKFYQNGSLVDYAYIEPISWTSFVMSFDKSLDLDNYIGQLELYEGFVYNNIALYQKSSDVLGTQIDSFTWEEFRNNTIQLEGESITLLETWDNKLDEIWNDFIEEIVNITYTINGKNIYESQLGLSKAISSDSSTLLINSDSVRILTDVEWSQYSGRAV